MNKEIRDRWVLELRSGKYRQAVGRLHSVGSDSFPGGHCCLGVLCEMAAEDGIVTIVEDEHARTYVDSDGEYSVAVPSELVRKWADLEDEAGEFGIPTGKYIENSSLAELNDAGLTFNQIADIIEWSTDL